MSGKRLGNGFCALCGRNKTLTFHHFIPRSLHTNKWFAKRYTVKELKRLGEGVCWDCHSFIHKSFPEKELGRNYNTLEKLIMDPKIYKFVGFIRKQIKSPSSKLLKGRR